MSLTLSKECLMYREVFLFTDLNEQQAEGNKEEEYTIRSSEVLSVNEHLRNGAAANELA